MLVIARLYVLRYIVSSLNMWCWKPLVEKERSKFKTFSISPKLNKFKIFYDPMILQKRKKADGHPNPQPVSSTYWNGDLRLYQFFYFNIGFTKEINLYRPKGFSITRTIYKMSYINLQDEYKTLALMIWTGFNAKGETSLIFTKTNMNSFDYQDILE